MCKSISNQYEMNVTAGVKLGGIYADMTYLFS
jgi:hypothetical protein